MTENKARSVLIVLHFTCSISVLYVVQYVLLSVVFKKKKKDFDLKLKRQMLKIRLLKNVFIHCQPFSIQDWLSSDPQDMKELLDKLTQENQQIAQLEAQLQVRIMWLLY